MGVDTPVVLTLDVVDREIVEVYVKVDVWELVLTEVVVEEETLFVSVLEDELEEEVV
eukprot:m.1134 g.1134  ORF g.1134 m.1134 type:complete len:57 (+) comp1007_c0_seq1:250-420(+)